MGCAIELLTFLEVSRLGSVVFLRPFSIINVSFTPCQVSVHFLIHGLYPFKCFCGSYASSEDIYTAAYASTEIKTIVGVLFSTSAGTSGVLLPIAFTRLSGGCMVPWVFPKCGCSTCVWYRHSQDELFELVPISFVWEGLAH